MQGGDVAAAKLSSTSEQAPAAHSDVPGGDVSETPKCDVSMQDTAGHGEGFECHPAAVDGCCVTITVLFVDIVMNNVISASFVSACVLVSPNGGLL